jgi:hypothetical protein
MSASLAAARKRRGVPVPEPVQSSPVNTQSQSQQPPGLTLPQVIALVDKRLLVLEGFMKEQKESSSQNIQLQQTQVSNTNEETITNDVIKQEIETITEEFNDRYELLAAEIQSIKDIVIKLQSFTMDVNKTLMEERIRILSDVEQSDEQSENAELNA